MNGLASTNPIPFNRGPIVPAGRKTISETIGVGNVPYMKDTFLGWSRPMTISTVMQTGVVDGQVQFGQRDLKTTAVIQPLRPKDLQQKPEGTRAWSWFTLMTAPEFVANTNDRIIIKGVKYRVMGSSDFSIYGFRQYEIVQGFQPTGGNA